MEYWQRIYQGSCTMPEYDHWLDEMIPALKGCETIVDLGCGVGVNSVFLAENGLKTICCDFSEASLITLKQHLPDAKTLCFNIAEGLPFEDASVDAVIADLSLHYFDWETTCCVAEDIRRMLKHGGLLLCRVNALEDYHLTETDVQLEENFYLVEKGHTKRFFDEDALRRMLASYRIEKVEKQTTRKYSSGFKYCWMAAARKA